MPIPIPSASDIIKLIKTGATIEAQEKIMELRQAVMDLQEENIGLRTQVLNLESQIKATIAPVFPPCPKCGKRAYAVAESKKDDLMGDVGGIRRTYRCNECAFTEEKLETQ